MAIDFRRETLFPVNQTPARLAKITGTRVHLSAIYRWLQAGRLDSVLVGGRRYVSEQAINRMIQRANRTKVVAADSSAHTLAERELDAAAIG